MSYMTGRYYVTRRKREPWYKQLVDMALYYVQNQSRIEVERSLDVSK
jgi:hypothetical protein